MDSSVSESSCVEEIVSVCSANTSSILASFYCMRMLTPQTKAVFSIARYVSTISSTDDTSKDPKHGETERVSNEIFVSFISRRYSKKSIANVRSESVNTVANHRAKTATHTSARWTNDHGKQHFCRLIYDTAKTKRC